MGEDAFGINTKVLEFVAGEVKEIVAMGVEPGLVIGAGNIFRGVAGASKGMDRTTADNMGMLATVMNSIALRETLESLGVATHIQTAIPMGQIAEPFHRKHAIHALERGHVVIFAAGTGHPFFTTDTAASLRAVEIEANAIFKATKVDGVYSADPVKDAAAVRFERITYLEVLRRQLKVMDLTAISFCMEHQMPIVVFNLKQPGNIRRLLTGEALGTLVQN